MKVNVVVVGSANLDIVVNVPRLPVLGETILGKSVQHLPGGKGLNQAIASAAAGVPTSFVGAFGKDEAGQVLHSTLVGNGVNVNNLAFIGDHSGTAHILVSETGGNQIVVVPASNSMVSVEQALIGIAATDDPPVVVLQGEIPFDTSLAAAEAAVARGGRVVFNLAPAASVDPKLLELSDPLVVNEFEAGLVLGIDAPTNTDEAMAALAELAKVSASAVITLGGAGVVATNGIDNRYIPAVPVSKVIDTTGAGDAFVGVLAAALSKGEDLFTASELANRAAGVTVERVGASESYSAIRELIS